MSKKDFIQYKSDKTHDDNDDFTHQRAQCQMREVFCIYPPTEMNHCELD